MSVTKVDIVERIYKETGITKKDAADFVDLVFETMKKTLAKGEIVKINGFGTFSVSDKSSRMGRNPQTGEPMQITERRVATFKPSNTLKEDITGAHSRNRTQSKFPINFNFYSQIPRKFHLFGNL